MTDDNGKDAMSMSVPQSMSSPLPPQAQLPLRRWCRAWPWVALTLVCTGLLGTAACDKKRTQIMLGIATDINAPTPLEEVRLNVFDLDDPQQLPFIEQSWLISGTPSQEFKLPGSFGIFSPDGNTARVRIEVAAYSAGSRLFRRTATMSLVEEQTLFMRMALVLACMSAADCPAGETCVEGICRAEEVDTHTFPRYQPAMEETLACDSGTAFMNTSTKELMAQKGPGCASNQFCREGTCYTPRTGKKRVGEPCSPSDACEPGSVCFNATCVGSGSLRVSLAWTASSDFDLHLRTPAGSEIYWDDPSIGGGELDVDQCADVLCTTGTHVENIVFASAPPAGVYQVWVENFDGAAAGAFTIEVAGNATATFMGTLPMTADATSQMFMFTVAAP